MCAYSSVYLVHSRLATGNLIVKMGNVVYEYGHPQALRPAEGLRQSYASITSRCQEKVLHKEDTK